MSNPLIPQNCTHIEFAKFPHNHSYIDSEGVRTVVNPTVNKVNLCHSLRCLVWPAPASDDCIETFVMSKTDKTVTIFNPNCGKNYAQVVSIAQIAEVWEMKNPFLAKKLTRAAYLRKYGVNHVKRDKHGKGDRVTLCNPTIDGLQPGMRCEVWAYKNPASKKTHGQLIKEVNLAARQILVGDYIGGTKETWDWLDPGDVLAAWSLGTFEEAMDLFRAFGAAVRETLVEQKRVLTPTELYIVS